MLEQKLKKLAEIKRFTLDMDTLNLYVKDLSRNFSDEQINFAIQYFMRRSKWFPDLADFYEFLAPMKEPSFLALEKCNSYIDKITNRADRDKFDETELLLFDVVSPVMIREATAITMTQHRKTLISFLTEIFRTPENRIIQHRETIAKSKERLPLLKNLLTN